MKFIVELTTQNCGRIGRLVKHGQELKTPLVLHYTKVSVSARLQRICGGPGHWLLA